MNRQPTTKDLTEIFSIALVSFVGILMTTGVNVNFPMLVNYFKVPLSSVQWFSTGAMIVSAITMICSAYADQRFNDRTVFFVATGSLLLSLIICTFATNYWLFLFGRLLDGVSIGSCTPLMFNVIPKLVPKSKIGFYMALGATVVATGPSLGPTYGGFINTYFNWRMIFVVVIPVILVVMLIGFYAIVNHLPIHHNLSLDWKGLALITVAFSVIAIGLNSLSQASVWTWIMFIIGIIALVWFVKHGHQEKAILHTRVFSNHRFTLAVITYFLIQLTNIGLLGLLIPNFSQVALGVTALVSGLILLPGNIFRIISMPFGGAMLDHYGPRLPIYIGLSLMAGYFLVMTVIAKSLGPGTILFAYIVYNLGQAICFSNVLTSGLQTLPIKQRGDGNAIFNAVQIYGGAVGTCLLSLIISLAGTFNPAATKVHAMFIGGQWCFGVLFALVIIALIMIHASFKKAQD